MLLAQNSTFRRRGLAQYNPTRVELKTFVSSTGSKFLSIENAVLGPVPKRLLFTMFKNTESIGPLNANSYKFRHYDISDFSTFLNGKHFPINCRSLGMDQEKTSVVGYRTLFESSGIHDSKSGLQITHDIYEGCNRRNGPNFGRMFLMLNYTVKPQIIYIQC